jgi:hypothetical protein
VSERAKTVRALDRAATAIGSSKFNVEKFHLKEPNDMAVTEQVQCQVGTSSRELESQSARKILVRLANILSWLNDKMIHEYWTGTGVEDSSHGVTEVPA